MAKITKQEEVAVEKLRPYEKNAKQHPEAQIELLTRSIEEFGFLSPCLIDKDYNIIAGHGRVEAAKVLGLDTVPCVFIEGLTEAQYKAYVLADNRLTELGGWDMELVNAELEELASMDFDLSLTGFDFDVNGLDFGGEETPEEIEEDEIPEEVETRTKPGDVWQLGRHRLMCGDSTSALDLNKLLGATVADMVFTDPPYGMKKEADGVANDNLNYDDLLEFNKLWIPLTFHSLKSNGSWYCWGIEEPLFDIYANILKPMQQRKEITFRNLITWKKTSTQGRMTAGFKKYPSSGEKCLFVTCGVLGFDNDSDHFFEGFEPLRSYLANEWDKVSPSHNWNSLLGNCMGHHYFTKSQWSLPTVEAYRKLQELGKECGAFLKDYETLLKEYEEAKEKLEQLRAFFDNTHDSMTDCWEFATTQGKEKEEAGGHATPKPLALCARAIKSSSRPGEVVLDVFGGSGSTLIACEELNRTAYLMELEPKWCDVIIQRWENLTGSKAEKVN